MSGSFPSGSRQIAGNGFEQICPGHHPLQAAIFVNDDRQTDAALLELIEHAEDGRRFVERLWRKLSESTRQNVESMSWLMQRKLRFRLRHGFAFDAKLAEFELTFPDPMHELNGDGGDRGAPKTFQPKHWTQSKSDRSVVLLNQIVQVFRGPYFRPLAALMLA
jgi:hypothetical protein